MSGNWRKSFKGQKPRVKVIPKSYALSRKRDIAINLRLYARLGVRPAEAYTDRMCGVEADLSLLQNVQLFITAQLGSAVTVVKVTFQVNGKNQFLGVGQKPIWGDKDKIWHS